jgi:hypothetical protein
MRLKKRTLAAIIAAIIVLAIIGSILFVNYLNYSRCKEADSSDKPGCFISEENKTGAITFPRIRFNFGSKYIDIG